MNNELLTAWALNELSDEERAEIEAVLNAAPEAAAKAAELKSFCELLSENLADTDAALDDERRAALVSLPIAAAPNVMAFDANAAPASVGSRQKDAPKGKMNLAARIIGIAACLTMIAVIVGLSVPSFNQVSKERLVAMQADQETNDAFAKSGSSESVRVMAKQAPVSKDMAAASPIQPAKPAASVVVNAAPVPTLPASPPAPIIAMAPPNSAATAGGIVVNQASPRVRMSMAATATRAPSTSKMEYPAPQIPQRLGDTSTFDVIAPTNERYSSITENKFFDPTHDPLSTFSIDVDSASYANVRRFLNAGQLPPADAIRLEELINYFPYDYEAPSKTSAQPFSVSVDVAEAPWEPTHRLARIGIKGREVGMERQQANFVFLVDVSGSMADTNKLPLVKRGLLMLAEQIKDDDRVAIVTYAGDTQVALESTAGKDRQRIVSVVESLHAGGSTNGASGITLAYEQAQKNFIGEGINRVVLCTDGDFNVGVSSPEDLEKLIKEKAKSNVFLSVLGFGTGNLKDQQMETLADKGNGNYAYIDSLSEARKVLVEQMSGTLITIAKDVKIQVEFNPTQVRSYRLLGYENRVMAKEDFNNDRKDAGEIGAGHTVTALYEIVPMDAPLAQNGPLVDDLKYQPKPEKKLPNMAGVAPPSKLEGINDELMTVKLRYKEPDGQLSKLIAVPVKDARKSLKESPKDFKFAAAVAGFGMMLRDSENRGNLSWEAIRKLALEGKGEDKLGYRGEFIQLIDKANGLK